MPHLMSHSVFPLFSLNCWCNLRAFGLFFKHLLDLADFLLDFSGELFVLTLCLQVRLVHDLASLLFHCACDFVNSAFELIFGTWFHLSYPYLTVEEHVCAQMWTALHCCRQPFARGSTGDE